MAEREHIKPAPAAYKADVWTHFGFINKVGCAEMDKTHAVCKMCHARVKYSGNMTNLRAHLARHHEDLPQTSNAKRMDPVQLTLNQVQSPKLPPTSSRAVKITQSVLYFICKDMRPLSVVENDGFRHLLTTLEPRYAIPS